MTRTRWQGLSIILAITLLSGAAAFGCSGSGSTTPSPHPSVAAGSPLAATTLADHGATTTAPEIAVSATAGSDTGTASVTTTPAAAGDGTPDPEVDTELTAPGDGSAPTSSGPSSSATLPDSTLTPGDVFPVGAGDICVSGYSSHVRKVSTSTKNAVYAEYHVLSHTTGQYEVDHLIPLELGGSNDIKNLWPEPAEPRPGFHEKDTLENKLHAMVCASSLDLGTAQHAIATNWWAAYVQYELGSAPVPAQPAAPPPDTSAPPPPPPDNPPPSSVSGVTFVSVVGAAPGGVASATVQTSGGASCSISYVTPAGTKSTAQGLYTKTAGADGTASWSWNIGGNTRPGTGTLLVTCDGASASAAITIG
jgi:hypothetical protein